MQVQCTKQIKKWLTEYVNQLRAYPNEPNFHKIAHLTLTQRLIVHSELCTYILSLIYRSSAVTPDVDNIHTLLPKYLFGLFEF